MFHPGGLGSLGRLTGAILSVFSDLVALIGVVEGRPGLVVGRDY